MSKISKITGVGLFVLLFLFVVVTFFNSIFFQEITVSSNHSFVLLKDYDLIRRSLVRGDSLKLIIEANNGKLLQHEWINMRLAILRIRKPRQWEVHGNGRFLVEYRDSHIGSEVVMMDQKVYINEDYMVIHIILSQSKKSLRQYETVMHIRRNAHGGTDVSTQLKIGVRVFAPKWLVKKERVTQLTYEAVNKNLRNGETILKQIIGQNRRFTLIRDRKNL